MRENRLWHRTTAQVSQPAMAWTALQLVRGATVADVGCGSGAYGYLLRAGWGHTESRQQQGIEAPERLYGLDGSARATALARRHEIYDRLEVCSATALALADDAVDTAVCLETVEHLYAPDVLPALRELVRVATARVIISTPAPAFLVDPQELLQETEAARRDPDFLGRDEYAGLESALHKSWLDPERMRAAGFAVHGDVVCGSHIYYGDPARVDLGALGEIPGIAAPDPAGPGADGDWRGRYVELLESVAALARTVPGLAFPGRDADAAAGTGLTAGAGPGAEAGPGAAGGAGSGAAGAGSGAAPGAAGGDEARDGAAGGGGGHTGSAAGAGEPR